MVRCSRFVACPASAAPEQAVPFNMVLVTCAMHGNCTDLKDPHVPQASLSSAHTAVLAYVTNAVQSSRQGAQPIVANLS